MSITSITSDGTVTYNNSASATTTATLDEDDRTSISQDDFITLLVEELTNQDPTSPSDTSEMVSQLTEMQNVEAIEAMTTSIESMNATVETMSEVLYGLAYDNTFQNACSLTGSYIYGSDSGGNDVEGYVASAYLEDGTIYLNLDDDTYLPYANITQVIAG